MFRGKEAMPCLFGDDAYRHLEFRIGPYETILYKKIFALQKT